MRSSKLARVLVTGAGGLIGNRFVMALKQRGYWVRGADTSPPEYTMGDADEFELRDLRRFDECLLATRRLREVLGWEPSVTLRPGLEPTCRWIEKQVLPRRPLLAATGG